MPFSQLKSRAFEQGNINLFKDGRYVSKYTFRKDMPWIDKALAVSFPKLTKKYLKNGFPAQKPFFGRVPICKQWSNSGE